MKYNWIFTTTLATALLFVGVAVVQAHPGDEHDEESAHIHAEAEVSASVRSTDDDSTTRGSTDDDNAAEGSTEEEDPQEARAQQRRSTSDSDTRSGGSAAVDGDADGDGVSANARGDQRARVSKEIDATTPQLMQALSIDQSSPLLYDGVSVSVSADACDDTGDCDDEDSTQPPMRRDVTVRVSGEQVRGWDAEQKEAVRQRLETANEANTANDFGIRVASAAIENENIVGISSDVELSEVSYNTTVRLLGFIPTNVTAVARADSSGEVSTDYPWYAFLASKGDQSLFSSLAADIRAAHDVMISVEEEGVKRTVRDTESEEN